MNLLLDTHVLLWSLQEPARLGQAHLKAIIEPTNRVWVSAITIWEIQIKTQSGKLQIRGDLNAGLLAQNFDLLSFTPEHARATSRLPGHHKDPFDRALLAQALSARLIFVTADSTCVQYASAVDILEA